MSDSEHRSPGQDPPHEDPVVVFRTGNDVEANLVAGLLQGAGINCNLSSDVGRSVFPFTLDGLGEVRVMVARDDEADALACIAARPEPDADPAAPGQGDGAAGAA